MDDAAATRRHAVLNVLVDFAGRQMTPALVDEIRDALIKAIEQGPCSWAFRRTEGTAAAQRAGGPDGAF